VSAFAALLKMDGRRASGPAPTYSPSHILLALLAIGDVGAIGRHALAVETGLGAGAIRTVIKWLREDGYIVVEPDGCRLTPKGKHAYSGMRSAMPKILELPETALTVGKEQAAVLVRKRAGRVKSGIEQRDSAIKAGAAGATTYVVSGSRFRVPGSPGDVEKEYPGPDWAKLRDGLRPDDGDVVIVCGSDDKDTSKVGAVSAALTLFA
jgi:hypothetical protein